MKVETKNISPGISQHRKMASTTCALMLLLGTLLLRSTDSTLSPHTLREIPDGVMVTKPEKIRIERGLWTVLVVLKDPSLLATTREKQAIKELAMKLIHWTNHHVECDGNDTCWADYERNWIIRRLQLLAQDEKQLLHITIKLRRKKRGLFNLGGTILKKIFGTATEADVQNMKKVVEETQQQNLKMLHLDQHLVTVINHAIEEQNEERKRINDLHHAIDQLQNTTLEIFAGLQAEHKIMLLRQHVDYLADAALEYYKSDVASAQIITDLESGRMTEKIFPRQLLREIIDRVGNVGLKPLSDPWYYQNVPIELIYMENGYYTYRIQLPFVNKEDYLLYDIATWPVPTNPNGLTVQILAKSKVAYDTAKGYMFTPNRCKGVHPRVCRSSPIYGPAYMKCERGIVTGHLPDREECRVKRDKTQGTILYDRAPGSYILQTQGEDISLICEGKREVKQTCPYGLYEVNVPPTCRVTGKDWMVYGEILRFTNVTLQSEQIEIPLFNLTWMQAQEERHKSPKFDKINTTLKLMTETPILAQNDDIDMYNAEEISHGLSWSAIILIIFIVIALSIAARYLYIHRQDIKFYITKPKKTSSGLDQTTATTSKEGIKP